LFEGNELEYLTDCVKSGWISSAGRYVRRFEEEFASYIGCKYGVALHTGTAALHLSIAALGIGPNDEVIVPTLTFASTANIVYFTGAKPILVDVEKDTWNIDPEILEQKISGRAKAVIPVHLYGHPCDMDRIIEIADKHEIAVIEDAAEAHGAEYKGKKVGILGTVGCFSFFGNKIITTGEGGISVCNDQELAEKMAKLRDHGMSRRKKYWHDEIGFNYRMTNLQAAVGVAQLERIDFFLKRKQEIARFYKSYLSEIQGIIMPPEKEWAKNVYWMFSILIDREYYRIKKDDLMDALLQKGIETRPIFYPLHRMPPYKQDGLFPNAEYISDSGLNLPSGVTLKDEEIEYICETLKKCLENRKI